MQSMLARAKSASPSIALVLRSMSTSTINASSIKVDLTKSPKPKPAFDSTLAFGKMFSDHMLEIDWCSTAGFSAPRIVPYHNLSLDPSIPALHYAVQCFEGMKAYKDKAGKVRLFRPDLNMTRFDNSCQRLALPAVDKTGAFIGWIFSVYKADSYCHALQTEALGVFPPTKALFYCILSPVGPYFKDGFAPVKVLAETNYRRAWPGGTGNSKVGGNYAPGLMPQKQAAQKGYSQVLWLFGEDDQVTEVGSMNLFVFWKTPEGREELITAPLDGTILPGVTRQSILEMTRHWGEFEVSERVYTMAEVERAVNEGRILEVFGAGTAAVVAPINGIGYKGKELKIPCGADGKAGKVTKRLFESIGDIHYGRNNMFGWSVEL